MRVFFIFFAFCRILHLFVGPLNVLSTSFRAKTTILYSGQNSWPIWPKGVCEQNWYNFFFLFFVNNFTFVYWTTSFAIYRFSCKNANIWIRSKFLTLLTQRHFRTKLIRVFFSFLSKEFWVCFVDLLMCYLQVFMQKRRHGIHVKILIHSEPRAFSYKIGTSFLFFFSSFLS